MNYSHFKKRAKHYLRKQLSLTHYIDVEKAEENIRKNIPFQGPNIYILFVAIVIASVGLNVNSIPVIIGAMLISPLMSPIIGFGMGLGTNDTHLLSRSLSNDHRAQLYANAEKHGISPTQIHILEDATIEVRRLNETEIMRDWLATSEVLLIGSLFVCEQIMY